MSRFPFRFLAATAAAAATLLTLSPARAHEYWLTPSTYRPAIGDTLRVFACVGTGFRGELKTFNPSRSVGFNLLATAPRSLLKEAVDGDSVWARVPVGDSQGLMISFLSNFAAIELGGKDFDRYLALEGLREPLEERGRLGEGRLPGRERYRRCPKLWVGQGGSAWSTIVGQPLEIIPLTDPARPGPLSLRLLADGEPAPGRLVRAWRQPLGGGGVPRSPAARDSVPPSAEAVTNARGEVRLDLKGRGEWLVSAVRMVRSANRAAADWESTWASLAFARP